MADLEKNIYIEEMADAARQFPQGMHGVALLLHCLALSRPTLEIGCHLSSCGCATVGWVGALYFFQVCHFLEAYRRDAASRSQRCSRPIHWNLTVWVAPRGAGGFSTGSGPASTVPHGRSGAACRCWLGTWPHDPAVGQHACAG